jgi:hypothetical protein
VQPPGRFQEDGFGLGGGVGGQVVGAGGEHRGMGRGEFSVGEGLGGLGQGAADQGPVVRTLLLAVLAPRRRR